MTYVIGIAGGTGSGKTTIADELKNAFNPEEVTLIAFDWYYRDLSHLQPEERAKINFDHPDSLEVDLLIQDVQDLKNGKPIDHPLYDFATHTRKTETARVNPAPIIILEGILALAYPDLLPLLDMKIFVDTEPDIRFIRRLERDIKERGRTMESVIAQYQATVRPMHREFVEPSKVNADIIIPEGRNDAARDTLIAAIKQQIAKGA